MPTLLARWVNRILARLFPKTWEAAIHRVATERGLTDAEVAARLRWLDTHTQDDA